MNKFIFIMTILFIACTSAQINQSIGVIGDVLNSDELTSDQVGSGLKEALVKGISTGSARASKVDGYWKNPKIKIGFPPDVQKVEDKLRDIGLGNKVDQFLLTLNRGAEEAAKEAKPIFVSAITSMTIQDAWGILRGGEDAATQYLIKTTTSQLTAKFRPVMSKALDQTSATKYFDDIVTTYNKIPFVDDVQQDLDGYATQKAIDGLFLLIAEEEKNIRKNPLARTTDLLKKVFAQQD